jgi:hypothetical protein
MPARLSFGLENTPIQTFSAGFPGLRRAWAPKVVFTALAKSC